MQALQLKLPPLLLMVLVGVMMAIVAYGLPGLSLRVPLREWLSIAFTSAGIWIACAGVLAFRRHHTTVDPTRPKNASSLVSTGVYRLSRNPMYLGFLLILCGWAVFLGSLPALLLLPLFVMYLNRYQILPEEQFLSGKFGRDFTEYCTAARRWV